ncbi:MAG: ACP S-malonyltransferase [Dehalococcoidales bacterium]|nr:ACP S-malonyltransferase [Dehalococcoidales bacterium]
MAELMKVAYVFPGQGSQWVGMGHDLYHDFDSAKAVFEQADGALGFSLSQLCFEGPEDELRQTINAQPAIVTVSFACLEATRNVSAGNGLPLVSFVAGHSLGEYTALAASGVLDFATTVYLARERGRLMHEAGQIVPGGMAAIIGLDEPPLAEVCEETGTRIANINCPGQIVISGAEDNLAQAMDLAKARGAYRAIPLQVSGAFHTPLMQPAVDGMAEVIATLSFSEPVIPIVGNTTAQPLTTAESIKEELLRQLCNCIQWQRSVEYMVGDGVSTFIELGPGKVLAGLIKRIDKNVKILNIGDAQAVKNIMDEQGGEVKNGPFR